MRRLRRFLSTLTVAAVLAVLAAGAGASGVSAYGRADHALAQLELSANCNNPDFPLCQPAPNGFGLGGVWLWIEIDAGGSGDVAGAGCGHVRGVGGAAGSIRGDITWFKATLSPGPGLILVDPTNTYYVISLPDGGTIPLPVTQGHYSFQPAPAVSIQLQVAP